MRGAFCATLPTCGQRQGLAKHRTIRLIRVPWVPLVPWVAWVSLGYLGFPGIPGFLGFRRSLTESFQYFVCIRSWCWGGRTPSTEPQPWWDSCNRLAPSRAKRMGQGRLRRSCFGCLIANLRWSHGSKQDARVPKLMRMNQRLVGCAQPSCSNTFKLQRPLHCFALEHTHTHIQTQWH